jgi:hypothetical protein
MIKNRLIFILYIVFFLSVFNGCGSDNTVINPGTSNSSDLTRTGKFISFTSNLSGNFDIYLAQVNSAANLETTNLIYPTNPFNLTAGNSTDDKQSNWSPDGRVLVFSRTNGNAQEIFAFFFKQDGSIDSSVTPIPKPLFSSGGNWDNNPFFSPDGKYLIWDRREDNNNPPGIDLADSRDLFIGNVTGSGSSMQITNPRRIITSVPGDEYNAKWSPKISVQRVAYEYQSSATATDHDVYIVDPLNGSNNNNFYNPNNSGYPAWAPACDKIIFESDKSSGDFWKIVSLSYPSNNGQPSDIQAIANVHLRYPTWLPNGGVISYIKLSGTGIGNIWISSSIGGGSPFQLIASPSPFDAANNLWPAW